MKLHPHYTDIHNDPIFNHSFMQCHRI